MSPIDLTYASQRSRFDYGTVGDITSLIMALPVRPWISREETVGGRRIAAAGRGASHIVRTDAILALTMRFRETDFPAVLAMIAWGQGEELITWFPDANIPATSFAVYLHQPATGTPTSPVRMADFPKVMDLTIELRRQDFPGTPWPLDFFGNL